MDAGGGTEEDGTSNPFAAAMQQASGGSSGGGGGGSSRAPAGVEVDSGSDAHEAVSEGTSPHRPPSGQRRASGPTHPLHAAPSTPASATARGGGGNNQVAVGASTAARSPTTAGPSSAAAHREVCQKRVAETERFWNFSTRPHQQAYSQLERRPQGAFLIRSSREKGFCTMSARVGNKSSIWNGRIRRRRSGFSLTEGGLGKEPLPKVYPSLVALIVDCVLSQ